MGEWGEVTTNVGRFVARTLLCVRLYEAEGPRCYLTPNTCSSLSDTTGGSGPAVWGGGSTQPPGVIRGRRQAGSLPHMGAIIC